MERNHTIIKNAIEFLLFNYFGLTLEDGNNKDIIIQKAVELAYNDATNQGAFNALFTEKSIPSEEQDNIQLIKNGVKELASVLEEKVKDLYDNNESFDEWHKNLCKKLLDKYQDLCQANDCPSAVSFFSYGNAQKWVNMTIKNLYVISGAYLAMGCEDNKSFFESVDARSSGYHIPLDNLILGEVYKQELLGSRENGPIWKSGKKEPSYSISDFKNDTKQKYTWSRIPSRDFYETFREKLEEAIQKEGTSIEWECKNWIKRKKLIKKLGKDLSAIDD